MFYMYIRVHMYVCLCSPYNFQFQLKRKELCFGVTYHVSFDYVPRCALIKLCKQQSTIE